MSDSDSISRLENRSYLSRRQSRWWVLLLLIMGALSTLWLVHEERLDRLTELRLQGEERLELYASTLKAAVARYEYLPYLAATDQEVIALLVSRKDSEGRQQALNDKLKRWQTASGASVLYVMDASGKVQASSNVDTPQSFLGQDYHFRPYFQDAMQGRQGRFFAIGYTTGLPGFFLSYPVSHHGQPVGVAVVKLDLTSLEKNWAAGGERVLVTDRDSVVFLASHTQWKYRSLKPLDPDTRQRLQDEYKYSGKDIIQLPTWQRVMGKETLPVMDAKDDEWLLMPRELGVLDGTLHYLASLQPVRDRARDTALLGMMVTLVLGLLASLWRMRMSGQRESRIHAASLARSAAQQRQIIRDTQAGLVTTDEALSVTFANPNAVALFGVTLNELVGTRLSQYLSLPERAAAEAGSEDEQLRLMEDRELEVLKADGARVAVLLSSRPLGKQSGYLITIHDISDLKAAENALREAHDELEQRVERRTHALNEANLQLRDEVRERVRAEKELVHTQNELIQTAKLAALGQMSAGIVHEINQPLAAINTYLSSARLLLQRGEVEQTDENLTDIQSLVRRMGSLISHLKSFASRSDGELRAVNLERVLANTLVLLKPRLDKLLVQPEIQMPDTELWVVGDEIRLEQVVVNLLRNALDAVADMPQPRVVMNFEAEGDKIDIIISDNGPGIAPEHIDRVFDPFFSTKETGEGMGLGLSVSYGIAREMGGQLSVSNEPQGGARFVLRLIPAMPGEKYGAEGAHE